MGGLELIVKIREINKEQAILLLSAAKNLSITAQTFEIEVQSKTEDFEGDLTRLLQKIQEMLKQ